MTQEEKDLVVKDLCAKLPYKTRVRYIFSFAGAACITGYSEEGILSYDKLQEFSLSNVGYETRRVANILPYLRPISSITEEEERELNGLLSEVYDFTFRMDELLELIQMQKEIPFHYIDWLNEHHFDYRGLIQKCLAIEAPKDMYK